MRLGRCKYPWDMSERLKVAGMEARYIHMPGISHANDVLEAYTVRVVAKFFSSSFFTSTKPISIHPSSPAYLTRSGYHLHHPNYPAYCV